LLLLAVGVVALTVGVVVAQVGTRPQVGLQFQQEQLTQLLSAVAVLDKLPTLVTVVFKVLAQYSQPLRQLAAAPVVKNKLAAITAGLGAALGMMPNQPTPEVQPHQRVKVITVDQMAPNVVAVVGAQVLLATLAQAMDTVATALRPSMETLMRVVVVAVHGMALQNLLVDQGVVDGVQRPALEIKPKQAQLTLAAVVVVAAT
jgi:hypothetical protein